MSINQSINATGTGNLIMDENDDFNIQDIQELEDEIIHNKPKKNNSLEGQTHDFDDYLKNLDAGFNLPLIDEQQKKHDKLKLQATNANLNTINMDSTDDESDSESENDTSQLAKWSPSNPEDTQLEAMTIEDKKQRHINKVLGNMERVDDDSTFINQEEEDDEVARNLEQIDLLKTNLINEGIDLSRVQDVNHNSPRKEIKSVLRILQIKNDRLRYCDMFEEIILSMAYGMESIFDGKNEYFGSKIDLVGWPESVKVKLHRMRYNTSSFVGDIMKGYNVGHGWRILLELLPSLLLYSRDRVKNNDNLISDNKYRDALIALQDK